VAGRGEPVLLGDELWRDLGAPPAAGQTLVLDGRACTVVGVLAADVRLKPVLGFEPAWWRPLAGAHEPVLGLARLRESSSIEEARAQLAVIAARLPSTGRGPAWTLRAEPVRGTIDPVARVIVALALAAILGIACLNVGNLLLSRALSRGRELGMRRALGATRGDVRLELLAEGVLLGLLGGVIAVGGSFAAMRLLQRAAAATNAEALSFEFDAWVWGAALLAGLLGGLLAGLAPALHGSREEPGRLLKEGLPGATASRSRQRAKRILIASEVALSLTLLSQAGVAIQSLRRLLALERGFRPHGVLVATVEGARGGDDAASRRALAREVLARAASVPGVRAVALASALPARGAFERYRAGEGPGASGRARLAAVSPGYFEALRIQCRAGRTFAEADDAGGTPVAIVNDTLPLALGSTVEIAGSIRTVVGIVSTLRNPPLQVTARPEIYVPWAQAPTAEAHLLVATSFGRPLTIAGPLMSSLSDAGGDRVGAARALEDVLSADMGVIRIGTILLALVALGALTLTAVWTYGVVSYLTGQRTREIGIRMALGAGRGAILRLVLTQDLRPVLVGTAAGLAGSIAVGRVLSSRVYGLQALDPVLIGAVGALFLGVTGLACWLPARRATRVEPATALRCE
jgi:putative ABC transport system permease protein